MSELIQSGWVIAFDHDVPRLLNECVYRLLTRATSIRNIIEIRANDPDSGIVGIDILSHNIFNIAPKYSELHTNIVQLATEKRKQIHRVDATIVESYMAPVYEKCLLDGGMYYMSFWTHG